MKRTLERELKVPELAEWEANGTSDVGVRLSHAVLMFCSPSGSVIAIIDMQVCGVSCTLCHRGRLH